MTVNGANGHEMSQPPPGFSSVDGEQAQTPMESAMLALEAAFHGRGWDVLDHPMVFALCPANDGMHDAVGPVPGHCELFMLVEVPIPEELWAVHSAPADAIRAVSALIALPESTMLNRLTRPEGIEGLVFIAEAWTVKTKTGELTRPELDEMMRFAHEDRLEEHPLSVESRVLEGITRDGTRALAIRLRGEEEATIERGGTDHGDVIKALRLMLDVVTQ